MLLSREKAAISQSPINRVLPAEGRAEPQEKPTIEGFFSKRDYTGALTLIEFELRAKKPSHDQTTLLKWKAITCVRIGNYEEAMRTYENLVENVSRKLKKTKLKARIEASRRSIKI
jgi:intraflagellar transport protein 56